MTTTRRPTIADLRSMKGQRQLSMLRVETLEETAGSFAAEIEVAPQKLRV